MLRSVPATALIVALAAALAGAQAVLPDASAPALSKEDIFDRLTPLAPAQPAASVASPAQPTTPDEIIAEGPPATTVRLLAPQPVVSGGAPADAPVSTAPSTTPAPSPAAAPAPQAAMTPKLRALLKPSATSSTASSKLPAHEPGAMTMLSASELQALINYVAYDFDRELGQLNNGARWQEYLRLAELQAACATSADEQALEKLPAIGQRFVALATQPEYKAVTKRHHFQTLHLALGEFLSLDDQRAGRQQLLAAVERFQQALGPVGTGQQWAGYFELAALQRLAANPTPVSKHDLVQLQLLATRFEQAAADPQFSAIAKLDGFTATDSSLRGLLDIASGAAPAAIDLAPVDVVASGEFAVPDDASMPLAQTSATVERLPLSAEGLQLIALSGKAFLQKQGDAAWKQIGKVTAASGDAIAARDEAAQLVLGESFALQLAPQTSMQISQQHTGARLRTELSLVSGSVKAIANARTGDEGEVLHLAMGDYQLDISGDDFAVEFRVEKADGRAVAIVHAGEASVENRATGDRAVVRAGREAVLLATGVALRAAPAKSDNWWTTPERPRSARRTGSGFSE